MTKQEFYPSVPQDPNEPSDWAKRLPQDGSFDLASGAGWFAKRAMQANPNIERNFRTTVRGLVGSSFSDDEIRQLEERALDNVEVDDLTTFHGIETGVPVDLTAKQRARIGGLLNRLGGDPLARRARDAFEQGVRNGKIRVR